jgi:pilus assembly protein FimV
VPAAKTLATGNKPVAPVAPKSKPVAPLKAQSKPEQATGQGITIKPGDTASLIATANKPANVSLDQMLVALMRANPDAFIKDNVNRIKAGAIVALPSEEQANALSAEQASQIIVAQSQDFNDFRRKLANNVTTAQVAPAGRAVTGKVQATVEEKKPSAVTPDKLTLSKGSVQEKNTEDQLAKARAAKEAATRAAEIAKNISDLSKLASSTSAPTATPAASSASAAKAAAPSLPIAPVVVASSPAPVASAAAPTATAAVSAPASAPAQAASVAASAPAVKVSAPKRPASAAVPPVEAPPEPSFIDALLENPLIPAAAAGLIALLAGLGFYKLRQRKKIPEIDSAFVESRLSPESFFGASGGQSVDTSDNLATGSSMVYSPSQLDAVDDVDPVAEADVYLAYGRDLQAEEILKDALRSNPERLAIHQKLLEIYTKRKDAKTFEAIATLAFNLTNGTGAEWEQICEKGLTLDPDNALYLPGGQPLADGPVDTQTIDLDTLAPTAPTDTDPLTKPAKSAEGAVELDLDLDFSLDDPLPELASADFNPEQTIKISAPAPELDHVPSLFMNELPAAAPKAASPEVGTIDFSLPEPEPEAPDAFEKTQVVATPAPAAPEGMLEFDLDSLSLDLGSEDPITESGALPNAIEDPLETKLALAEEFKAIGDDDGARALIEEVIAEASGEVKAKAQSALNRL